MTQIEKTSVRNAESVSSINNAPTFEEVIAIPYVRESLRSLVVGNSRLFPFMASYEDDISQEMLMRLRMLLL